MRKLIQSLKIVPRWIILLIDLGIFSLSLLLSYSLRFNFEIDDILRYNLPEALLIYMFTSLLGIFVFASHSGIIRHTGLQDALKVTYASTLSTALVIGLNFIATETLDRNLIPLSVILISYILSVFLLTSYRMAVKLAFGYYTSAFHVSKNIAIFGAGNMGLMTRHLIGNNMLSGNKVVAFLEDSPLKVGKSMGGTRIYDARKDFKRVIKRYKVDELIIAITDLNISRKNEIVDICLEHQVLVRTVPPVEQWVKGELTVNQIKKINIEDLLGRESISLDIRNVKEYLKNRVVLVTGAAGSIGGEIVRQVIQYHPKKVIMLDQSESGLFEICHDIRKGRFGIPITEIIGDITDEYRLKYIFSEFMPDLVFHAAAYKHVPIMESNVYEAIRCNILGTKKLADIAVEYGVEKFVLVSTDKAVNPTSVMGASKRIAELYVQSLNSHLEETKMEHTRFITTRFGNVLGSSGSVIPVFKKQIENGGPITVTHPEITRFFMTIPEACQLVLEAGAMGNGGEIYIFDMGHSIKIVELANRMVELSGLKIGRDIEIRFTGLRKGEKLYEELLANKENTQETHHPKILIAKVQEQKFEKINKKVLGLESVLSSTGSELESVRMMKEMVEEYKSNNSDFEVLDQDAFLEAK